jgi:hypothetical protein
MIIARIFQGPGNQLFQYAAARALALRHGTELRLDLRWYHAHSGHRAYCLDRFNIQATEATVADIDHVLCPVPGRLAYRWGKLYTACTGYPYYGLLKEDLTKGMMDLRWLRDGLYLDGYFSSEAYFAHHAAAIRQELTLRDGLSAESLQWAARMQACNSVAVSFRRGDFVGNPLHDVCGMDYYQRALDQMRQRVGTDIELFVWSDDMDWVRATFAPPVPMHLMTHNRPDFIQDLVLMGHCRHHIIPNSTFSWWGAWLGQHPGQVVMAPGRWLNSATIPYTHYLPQHWVRISN